MKIRKNGTATHPETGESRKPGKGAAEEGIAADVPKTRGTLKPLKRLAILSQIIGNAESWEIVTHQSGFDALAELRKNS